MYNSTQTQRAASYDRSALSAPVRKIHPTVFFYLSISPVIYLRHWHTEPLARARILNGYAGRKQTAHLAQL